MNYFKTTPTMKWTIIIIGFLSLTDCNDRANKTAVDEKNKMVLNIESKEENSSGGQPYKKFHNCNFDKFITDSSIPKLAKDIYLDNNWNLSNENEALVHPPINRTS